MPLSSLERAHLLTRRREIVARSEETGRAEDNRVSSTRDCSVIEHALT